MAPALLLLFCSGFQIEERILDWASWWWYCMTGRGFADGGWFGGGHGRGDVRACVGVAGGEGGEGWWVGWWVNLEHFLVGKRKGDGVWMRVVEKAERMLMGKAEREMRRVERVFGGEDAGGFQRALV